MRRSRLTISSICLAAVFFVAGCGPGAEGSLLALLPVLATAPLDELNKQYTVVDADANRVVILATESQPFNPLSPPTTYQEPEIRFIVYDLLSNTARSLEAPLMFGGYGSAASGDWMASLVYPYPSDPNSPGAFEAAQRASHVSVLNLRTGATENLFQGLEFGGKIVTQVSVVSDRWLVVNLQERVIEYDPFARPQTTSVILDRSTGGIAEVAEAVPAIGGPPGYTQGMLLGDEVIFLTVRFEAAQPTVLPDGTSIPPYYGQQQVGFDVVRFHLATHARVVMAQSNSSGYASLQRMGTSLIWNETSYNDVQTTTVLKRLDPATGAEETIYSRTSGFDATVGESVVGTTANGLVLIRQEGYSPLGIGVTTTAVHRDLSGSERVIYSYTIDAAHFPWYLFTGASPATANGDGYVLWRDAFDGDWKVFDVASGGTRTIVIE